MMANLDMAIIAAWNMAADDLGIRVHTPHELRLTDGSMTTAEGFLPDFGGRNGMVFVGSTRRSVGTDLYVSILYDGYRRYDRTLFIGTLNDWGWFGDARDKPAWHIGTAEGGPE